jgi:long-chain acyl-CoA synthetase
VDRARAVLKCGGRRISCQQLEDQLLESKGALEVAVIPMLDDVFGEAVKAFIVPREAECRDLEPDLHLILHGAHHPHLVPRKVVVVRALPKNSSGRR